MAMIYDRAERILVWLGEDATGEGALAFKTIRGVNQTYQENLWVEDFVDEVQLGFNYALEQVTTRLERLKFGDMARIKY
jgi:hypothetical protein